MDDFNLYSYVRGVCKFKRLFYYKKSKLCISILLCFKSIWNSFNFHISLRTSLQSNCRWSKGFNDNVLGINKFIKSFCLVGYSLILYFIPTILCVLPSFLWHAAVLGIGAILRIIFMFRNYGKFVEAVRSMTLLFVFLAI